MDEKKMAALREEVQRERVVLEQARLQLGDLHTPQRVTSTQSAEARTRTGRGFRAFGCWDHLGSSNQQGVYTYDVYESSLAFHGPHVWIFARPNETARHDCGTYTGSLHLSLADARVLRDALDLFIADAEAGKLVEREPEDEPGGGQ